MKVRAKIDCVGLGYYMKTGEEQDVKKEVAEKLIKFDYVEKVKGGKEEIEVEETEK